MIVVSGGVRLVVMPGDSSFGFFSFALFCVLKKVLFKAVIRQTFVEGIGEIKHAGRQLDGFV
jgi:hypothetical protein